MRCQRASQSDPENPHSGPEVEHPFRVLRTAREVSVIMRLVSGENHIYPKVLCKCLHIPGQDNAIFVLFQYPLDVGGDISLRCQFVMLFCVTS